jgi:hypothetical protein
VEAGCPFNIAHKHGQYCSCIAASCAAGVLVHLGIKYVRTINLFGAGPRKQNVLQPDSNKSSSPGFSSMSCFDHACDH